MAERTMIYMRVSYLVERFHPANPKDHNLNELRRSMERFGFTEAVLFDERTEYLAAGHGRVELLALDQSEGRTPPDDIRVDDDGEWLVPVQRGWASKDDMELLAYVVASNRLTEIGGWVDVGLADALEQISKLTDFGLEGVGFSLSDIERLKLPPPEPVEKVATRKLQERFLVPPFSILDARQGYWQERKRAWISLGIRSEEGRPTNALVPGVEETGATRLNAGAYGATTTVAADGTLVHSPTVGITSIFDPVLCEVAYRWWCPEQGSVIDPFAGGSVRGVVAQRLGLSYYGVDLRSEQVEANREQGAEIRGEGSAIWEVGDSRTAHFPERADFVFTCPPYFDLETYSDDPADIANAGSYDEFLGAYSVIIERAVSQLKQDRFACIVVGEVRDQNTGMCQGLVPDTITLFEQAGTKLYNEAILVTPVGSLAVRAARIFSGARKVAKGHQNVLVFVKGDPQKAADACAPVDHLDFSGMAEEEEILAPVLSDQDAIDRL